VHLFDFLELLPTSSSMANLLSLPREIRDQVFSILLFDPLLASLPSIAEVRKRNNRRDPDDISARKVRYPSQVPTKSPIDRLLGVNRQLHDEVQEAITHFQKCGGAAMTLDLLLEDNRFFFPSWIQVLPYAMPVKTMHIQIRPFAEVNATDADPFVASWRLGHLINNFLKSGPRFISATRTKAVIVENLVLYVFLDPALEDPRTASRSRAQVEAFQKFLISHIDGFLTVKDKRYHVPWGPMLLSRIQKLTIMVGGKVAKEVDIAARAKDCGVRRVELPKTLKGPPEPHIKPEKFRAGGQAPPLKKLQDARYGSPLQDVLARDTRSFAK
jgi:hypothetical protein